MHSQSSDLFVLLPLLEILDQGFGFIAAHLDELVWIKKGDPLVFANSCRTSISHTWLTLLKENCGDAVTTMNAARCAFNCL